MDNPWPPVKRKAPMEPLEKLCGDMKRLSSKFATTACAAADGQPLFPANHLAALTQPERARLRAAAAAVVVNASSLVAQLDATTPKPAQIGLRAIDLPDVVWWAIVERLAYADVLRLASVSNGFRTMVADSGRVAVLNILFTSAADIHALRSLAKSKIAHLYIRARKAAFRITSISVNRRAYAATFAATVNAVMADMPRLTLLEVGSTSREIPMAIRRDNPIVAPNTVRCVVDDVQGGWVQSATATVYYAGVYMRTKIEYCHVGLGPGAMRTVPARTNVVDIGYMMRCPLVNCVRVPPFHSDSRHDKCWFRDLAETTAQWAFPGVKTLQLDAKNIGSALFSKERLSSLRRVIVRQDGPFTPNSRAVYTNWKGRIMTTVADLYSRLPAGCMLYIDEMMFSCISHLWGLPLTRLQHMFAKLAAIGGSNIRVCANSRTLNHHKNTVWRTPVTDGSEEVVYIVGLMNGKVQRIVPFAQYISKEDMVSSPIYPPV